MHTHLHIRTPPRSADVPPLTDTDTHPSARSDARQRTRTKAHKDTCGHTRTGTDAHPCPCTRAARPGVRVGAPHAAAAPPRPLAGVWRARRNF